MQRIAALPQGTVLLLNLGPGLHLAGQGLFALLQLPLQRVQVFLLLTGLRQHACVIAVQLG
ncbi:hypothetical protein FQZ97_854800 [compost metagenome]